MRKHNFKTALLNYLSSESDVKYTIENNRILLPVDVTEKILSCITLKYQAPYYNVGDAIVVDMEDPLARILDDREIDILHGLVDDLPLSLRMATYGVKDMNTNVGYVKFVSEQDILAMEFLMIEHAIEHEVEEA